MLLKLSRVLEIKGMNIGQWFRFGLDVELDFNEDGCREPRASDSTQGNAAISPIGNDAPLQRGEEIRCCQE